MNQGEQIMQDRFKFNAVVSSYYDIDTPEEYKEVEPQFYLKNVDVFCTGEIGIDYDVLFDTVKQQVKNLSEKEIGQIMQHFEDNSNSPECDFVTIKPDKILQCTGLKDKNGTLIYEGDIVYKKGSKNWKNEKLLSKVIWSSNSAAFMISDENGLHQMPMNSNNIEILGNIYETPELIGGAE